MCIYTKKKKNYFESDYTMSFFSIFNHDCLMGKLSTFKMFNLDVEGLPMEQAGRKVCLLGKNFKF